jgi:hypothetical protein
MRQFDSGATRDNDDTKPDYEGYLSPIVIKRFGEYMTKHRIQADGSVRDSDNWQKGIPLSVYMKSLWRHFLDLWTLHRASKDSPVKPYDKDFLEESLCAILFNTQGYLLEIMKWKEQQRLSKQAAQVISSLRNIGGGACR